MASETICILVVSSWGGNEERGRFYFRSKADAIAKAREMMDAELPKGRKTRWADVAEGVAELERDGVASSARLYSEYRIESAVLN